MSLELFPQMPMCRRDRSWHELAQLRVRGRADRGLWSGTKPAFPHRTDQSTDQSMDEIVKDFLIESSENLDRLDQELVKLESEPSSKELLASVFRTIHTIKGSCGFLGFARLEKLAHAGESLLSRLREGELTLSAEITSGLLAMVDAVRHMLAAIQASEQDGEDDYAPLIQNLARLRGEPALKSPAAAPTKSGEARPQPPPAAEGENAAKPVTESAVALQLPSSPTRTKPGRKPRRTNKPPNPDKVTEEVVAQGADHPAETSTVPMPESRQPDATAETIRVGVTLLDRLMNLVGELVLARNQLLQFSNSVQDVGLQAVSQRMNLIATELQEEVMKTRMQPIDNIWSKFPRTVRDLALSCRKEVRLEMKGKDTELDRTIIEAIKDPLTHLVRNAMDHGIEEPEARRRAGKSPTGVLTLRAFHEGGQVNIEISDDGGGLNRDRIRQKAMERGLITAQQSSLMPDRDVFNLIFLPGFSTAEKITNVSGRGVGMDVVKTNVERIGGAVDVQSTPGRGTTVRVKIPLTLAIIPALIVTCGGERFAIPQVSLSELVRLDSDANGKGEENVKGIELVWGAPVYRLRGRLLPLVYLDRELAMRAEAAIDSTSPSAAAHLTAVNVNIVVLQAEGQQFGLVVDEIIDTEEIVVKPLGRQLKGVSAYSGATIMGDGRVALILDVPGLARRAQVIAEAHTPAHDSSAQTESGSAVPTEAVCNERTLLLAENGTDGRVAIPLSTVARLEEFPPTVVERAGSQDVMQYRGQIIPLVRLSEIIPATRDADLQANAGSIQVVVYAEGKRTVGLIVDRIVDIVEERATVESLHPRTGVVGSFVTQGHVTDLLDVPALVRAAVPGLLDEPEPQAERM
jgi:two-component system, chemotaxis family, sensor kinase CheA